MARNLSSSFFNFFSLVSYILARSFRQSRDFLLMVISTLNGTIIECLYDQIPPMRTKKYRPQKLGAGYQGENNEMQCTMPLEDNTIPPGKQLKISYSSSLYDPMPSTVSVSLKDLCEILCTHEQIGSPHDTTDTHSIDVSKKAAPLIFFGEMSSGTTIKDVKTISALALDLDNIGIDSLPEKVKSFFYIAHTTHKHRAKCYGAKPRWRAVFPLDEPIPAEKGADAWKKFYILAGQSSDAQCSNINRRWYLPSTYDLSVAESVINPGRFLSTDDLKNVDLDDPTLKQTVVGHDDGRIFEVQEIIRKRGRQSKKYSLLHEGKAFAEEGERRKSLRDITYALAHAYRRPLSQEDITAIFSQSLNRMQEDTPEDAYRAYSSALGKVLAKDTGTDDLALATQRKALGTRSGYTRGELKNLAESVGVADLKHYWILNYRNENFFLDATGKYRGPFGLNGFFAACREHLSRAPLQFLSADGECMSPTQIKAQHSTNISEIVYDVRISSDKIDGDALIIGTKSSLLGPEENKDIAHWLWLLSGEDEKQHDILLDTLAIYPDLTKPAPIVAIQGPKDIGKSLLARGLSRLFCKHDPTPLGIAIAEFNGDLKNCPLVWADEGLPNSRTLKIHPTEWLRERSIAESHMLNIKFLPHVRMHGYLRFFLSSNESILSIKKNATKDTLAALAQRIFFMAVGDKAAKYLDRFEPSTIDSWEKGGIARHCLWVSLHRNPKRQSKVTILVDAEKSLSTLALSDVGGDDVDIIFETIALALQGNLPDLPQTRVAVLEQDGQVFVNTSALTAVINIVHKRQYTIHKMGRFLRASVCTHRHPRIGSNRYRQVNTPMFLAWLENSEF